VGVRYKVRNFSIVVSGVAELDLRWALAVLGVVQQESSLTPENLPNGIRGLECTRVTQEALYCLCILAQNIRTNHTTVM